MAFTNKLTFDDLLKIKDELRTKGIKLTYNKLEFNNDKRLKSIDFNVDSGDGFMGTANLKDLTNNRKVGFYRDYSKDCESCFGTGVM